MTLEELEAKRIDIVKKLLQVDALLNSIPRGKKRSYEREVLVKKKIELQIEIIDIKAEIVKNRTTKTDFLKNIYKSNDLE